jgi:hypothetical protein
MPSLEEIETRLQGPGALFEVGRAEVKHVLLGETHNPFVEE